MATVGMRAEAKLGGVWWCGAVPYCPGLSVSSTKEEGWTRLAGSIDARRVFLIVLQYSTSKYLTSIKSTSLVGLLQQEMGYVGLGWSVIQSLTWLSSSECSQLTLPSRLE